MTLSKAYLEWKETTLQQGVQQERRHTVENFLRVRFGALDEDLLAVVQPFAELPAQEYAALLLRLANLSREALLAKFGDKAEADKAEADE